MRRNLSLIAHFFDGFDAMQDARSRRPQLYFVKKPEKLYPFAIVPFAMLFDVFFRFHTYNSEHLHINLSQLPQSSWQRRSEADRVRTGRIF